MVPSCVVMGRVIIIARVTVSSHGMLCHFRYNGTCYYDGKCNFVMVKLPTGGKLKKNPNGTIWGIRDVQRLID